MQLTHARATAPRILYYHRIDDEWHRSCVSPRAFGEQMQYLRDHGYRVLPLGALSDGTDRAVAITFDDGFADNFTQAFPVLTRLGMPATIFVTVGAVGGQLRVLRDHPGPLPALTWSQLREMTSGGIAMGSHTLTHPHLTRLDAEALEREVTESRARLTAETGVVPESFCYPHGDVNAAVRAAVARAGYRVACSTRPGAVSSASDPLCLPRTFIARDDTLADFGRKLVGAYDYLHQGVQLLRRRWGASHAA